MFSSKKLQDYEQKEAEFILKLLRKKDIPNVEAAASKKQFLRFDKCQLTNKELVLLAQVMSRNSSLEGLSLKENSFTGKGFKKFIEQVLPENRHLQELFMYGNKLQKAETSLGKILEKFPCLRVLDLNWCNICDVGLTSLAEALVQHQFLTVLGLGYNDFTISGLKKIGEALKSNKTLDVLFLRRNKITDQGIYVLSEGLTENHSLRVLDLGDNQISDAGAMILYSVFNRNFTLTEVNFEENEISENMRWRIDQYLVRNRALAIDFLAAVANNKLEEVKKAVQQGVSLRTVNKEGDNAMHVAVLKGHIRIVGYLLSLPFDWKTKNDEEKTPLDLAIETSHVVCVRLLREGSSELSTTLSSSSFTGEAQSGKDELSSLRCLFVKYDNLTFGDKLGEGAYGAVYCGQWLTADVAIKQLKTDKLSHNTTKSFVQEAQMLGELNHPNVIQLFGICVEGGNYCLVMEYMSRGSLRSVLKSEADIPWPLRRRMAHEISKALLFLHDTGVLHRDLKGENVLVGPHMEIKIADLGLAIVKEEVASQLQSEQQTVKPVGTLLWMAPELLLEESESTRASDVYAFGVVLWELTARRDPFQQITNKGALITHVAVNGLRESIPPECPKPFAALIEACWQQEAEKRPTIQSVESDVAKMRIAEGEIKQEELLSKQPADQNPGLQTGPHFERSLSQLRATGHVESPMWRQSRAPSKRQTGPLFERHLSNERNHFFGSSRQSAASQTWRSSHPSFDGGF